MRNCGKGGKELKVMGRRRLAKIANWERAGKGKPRVKEKENRLD